MIKGAKKCKQQLFLVAFYFITMKAVICTIKLSYLISDNLLRALNFANLPAEQVKLENNLPEAISAGASTNFEPCLSLINIKAETFK